MLPWKCFSSCTVLKKFKLRNEKTNMSEFLCQEHPLMNRSVRRLTVETIRTTTLLVRPRRAEQSPTSRAEYFCWCERKKKSSFYTFYRNIVTGAVLSQCSQILHHTATNFTATGWKSFSHVEERRRAQTEEDGRNRLDLNHVCKQVSGPPQSCSVQQETETSHCSHSAVRTVENTKNYRSRTGSRRNQSAKTSADDSKLH